MKKAMVLGSALFVMALTGCGESLHGNLTVNDAAKFNLTNTSGKTVTMPSGPVTISISKPLFGGAKFVIKADNNGPEIDLPLPDALKNSDPVTFNIPGNQMNQTLNLNGFQDASTSSAPYQQEQGCDIPGCSHTECQTITVCDKQASLANLMNRFTASADDGHGTPPNGTNPPNGNGGGNHGTPPNGNGGGNHGTPPSNPTPPAGNNPPANNPPANKPPTQNPAPVVQCHPEQQCEQVACPGVQWTGGTIYTTTYIRHIQFLNGSGTSAEVVAEFQADPTYSTSTDQTAVGECHADGGGR